MIADVPRRSLLAARLLALAAAVMTSSVAPLIAPLAAQRPATPVSPPLTARLVDSLAEAVRQAFDVPGLAVAVVRDGQVVVAKGYGMRALGEPAPVDAATRFGIASNSKLFTATALAILVDEGRIAWDDPVVRHLPAFALSDPWVTSQLTVRDLLVHRSGLGLGAGDLLWWPASTWTRREIAHRLRYVPLATSFRSAYAYDNVLYLVAGELIEAVTGLTWERFVTERLLKPVGMTGSTPNHSDAAAGGNTAATHARVEGRLRPVPPMTSDNTNPAGGIMSGASDMARWLVTQLDSGRAPDGTRVFPAAQVRELWQVVTPIPVRDGPPELAAVRPRFLGYGLGVNVRDYRGERLLTHTGGLPGYVSLVMLFPDRRTGVAVLTNAESGAAFNALGHAIADAALGAPRTDWVGTWRRLELRGDSALAAELARGAASRDTASRPSRPLAAYVGRYEDPWYGSVTVTRAGDTLRVRFDHTPALEGTLEHWQYDTFVARWTDRTLRADAFMTFRLDETGRVTEARMAPFSSDVDFSFDFQDLRLTRRP